MSTWQPEATAPPNRKVMIAWPGIVNIGRKINGRWFAIGQNTPMVDSPKWWGEIPLPPPYDGIDEDS